MLCSSKSASPFASVVSINFVPGCDAHGMLFRNDSDSITSGKLPSYTYNHTSSFSNILPLCTNRTLAQICRDAGAAAVVCSEFPCAIWSGEHSRHLAPFLSNSSAKTGVHRLWLQPVSHRVLANVPPTLPNRCAICGERLSRPSHCCCCPSCVESAGWCCCCPLR